MKKLLALMLAVMLCLCQPAMAVNRAALTYRISLPDAEISFQTSVSMLCLTRHSSASTFSMWGLDQQETLAGMEAEGIYAIMVDVGSGTEYYLYVYEWETIDYDTADDTQLQMISAENLKLLRADGVTVNATNIYRSAGHTFVYADCSYPLGNGDRQESLRLFTNKFDYEFQIVVYPLAGKSSETVKAATLALADSVRIVPTMPEVTTTEPADGSVVLETSVARYIFTPLDVRYALTRNSGRYLFERMGYDREEMSVRMRELDLYAILYDRLQRARIQVHLMREAESQPYVDMTDFLRVAAERNWLGANGWTVGKISVLQDSELGFVKSSVSTTLEDGTTEGRLVYGTAIDGLRIEIQVLASGSAILEAVEAEVDELVRGIRRERKAD